jgi:hypothetical protein
MTTKPGDLPPDEKPEKPPEELPQGSDEHMGAVEGDRPTDVQEGNRNAPALDDQGLPNDAVKICEDTLGANVDGSEGG